MKTCFRFASLRAEHELEISCMTNHSRWHAGRSAAKSSARQAIAAKQRMARALSGHVERCPECG